MSISIPNHPWLRAGLVVAASAALTALGLQLYGPAPVELPTAEVERRDFLRTVRSRGELKSAESVQITAPQTPNLQIVELAENGKPIVAGEIVVRFDESAQEDTLIERETEVRQVDSEIEQAEASHAITDERNEMMIMQATYNVERAGLEASKQEILAEIEAEKAKIDVTIAEGELQQTQTTAEASDMSQAADIERLMERKGKAQRDLNLSRTYLRSMVLRAPADGIVHILPNNRAQGELGAPERAGGVQQPAAREERPGFCPAGKDRRAAAARREHGGGDHRAADRGRTRDSQQGVHPDRRQADCLRARRSRLPARAD